MAIRSIERKIMLGDKKIRPALTFARALMFSLLAGAMAIAAPTTGHAKPFSAFRCVLREGGGTAGAFNWWSYDYSGYRWINCTVEAAEVRIDAIRLNRGNCNILDTWFINRSFTAGQTLDISHACMSPVMLEIDANGRTSVIPLK